MMRKLSPWLPVLLYALVTVPVAVSREPTRTPAKVDVHSPSGGCQARIVVQLRKARRSIKIQAYSFTNAVIAKALLDAGKRGGQVEVILDKSNRTDRDSAATFLHNQGIAVLIDARHTIAHNKIVIIIIDDETAMTGSYNFSKSADEGNAENLLVLSGMPDLERQYVEHWERHRTRAEPYAAPTVGCISRRAAVASQG